MNGITEEGGFVPSVTRLRFGPYDGLNLNVDRRVRAAPR
jgi:hypothetical protein